MLTLDRFFFGYQFLFSLQVLCSGTDDIHSCTYFDYHYHPMLSTEIVILRRITVNNWNII